MTWLALCGAVLLLVGLFVALARGVRRAHGDDIARSNRAGRDPSEFFGG